MFKIIHASSAVIAGICLATGVSAAPIVNPTGDTFNTGTPDITSFELKLGGGGNLNLTVNFASAISAASAFASNSVVGFVDGLSIWTSTQTPQRGVRLPERTRHWRQ